MIATPDTPRLPRGALVAMLAAVSIVSAGYGIVLPILPLMLQSIDGPGATAEVARHTGMLTGVHAVALFLFAPFWGWLSDRRGRRRILVIGLVGFSLSLLVSTIKPTIGLLYAERFLSGVFAAAITPVASAFIADLGGDSNWRARHLAWVSMASISGFLLGPMLSGFLATLSTALSSTDALLRPSFELPFVVIAVLALASSLAVRTLLPDGEQAQSVAQEMQQPRHDGLTATILTLRGVGFVVAAGVGAFEVGLALRGNLDLGMDPRRVAFMFTTCSLVMFVVQGLVFSPFTQPAATRWLISPALVVMAVALLLVPQTIDYAKLLALVAIVAASAGILAPILTYWLSLAGGQTKGAVIGKQVAVANLGQAVGSFAGGSLLAGSPIPGTPFILSAGLLLAMAWAAGGLPGRLARTPADSEHANSPQLR